MHPLLRVALQVHIVRNALKVSLVVGTLLNAINQGERILSGGGVSWRHFIMNFVVPLCVSTYSAAKNELAQSQRRAS